MADIPTRIAAVELRCSDVEASAEFYSGVVGLEPSEVSLDRAELGDPEGGPMLLVLTRAERGGWVSKSATGLFHTAFRYPDRAGLAAAVGRLDAFGATLTGVADHGVSEAIYLDDPDGMGIELYRDRPTSQWPKAADGEGIQMLTEPLDLDDLASDAFDGVGGEGVDIGHVHLKVADATEALGFWTEEVGLELMTHFGSDAIFCSFDGYHHHIGANAWSSRGAEPEPAEGPGLTALTIDAPGEDARTAEGIEVRRGR